MRKTNYSKVYKQISDIGHGRLTVYENYHKEWLSGRLQAGRATANQAQDYRNLVQRQQLQNLVRQTINQVESSPLPPAQNPANPKGTKKQEDTDRDNKLKKWNTSIQALSITARSIYAYGNIYFRDRASTDRVQGQIHGLRAAESAVSCGLSLIPVFGPMLTTIWSLGEQIFSKRIANGIQRRGDNKRIAYNFANYDLGKYGTYAYDNTSQEWVAQDANKVKARSLGQKQSV